MKKKLAALLCILFALALPCGALAAEAPDGLAADPQEQEALLPPWYPSEEERASFQFFNDSAAPRVADFADVLTDAEEDELAEYLQKLSVWCGADIVIVTDSSSYGLTREQYADDFYDYLGYGFGETRDGILLFLCLEPGNRGWWVSACGRIEPLNDQYEIAEEMDDRLERFIVGKDGGGNAYFREDNCFNGFVDWAINAAELCRYGILDPPAWYPTWEEQAAGRLPAKGQADYVYDETGTYSEADRAKLAEELKELSEQYGVQFVLHTAAYDHGLSSFEYAQKFYQYNGLGNASDGAGLLCVVFEDYGSYYLYSEGADKILAGKNEERLRQWGEENGRGAAGAEAYIKALTKTLKKGRTPALKSSWISSVVAAVCGGSFFGFIKTGKAKRSMKVVASARSASSYLVNDSFELRDSRDEYLSTSTTRVYDPPKQDRSSGGGHSSSSHTSHSGSSHSGHGRGF